MKQRNNQQDKATNMNENENSKLNNNLVKINLSLNRDQVNEIDVLSL